MLTFPTAKISRPSSGKTSKYKALPRHIIDDNSASSSFKLKYKCPDFALVKPETSPLTLTLLNLL